MSKIEIKRIEDVFEVPESIIIEPKSLEINTEDESMIEKMKKIGDFKKVIDSYKLIDPRMTWNFYNNLDVNIKKNGKIASILHDILCGLKLSHRTGCYDIKENKIRILSELSTYHELYHLSSARRNPNTPHEYDVGFYYEKEILDAQGNVIENRNIGDGLNEGMTQLLTNEKVGNKYTVLNTPKGAYYRLVDIVKKLRNIINIDSNYRLEELYFLYGLKGLVNDLLLIDNSDLNKNYISDFVHYTDLLYDERNKSTISDDYFTLLYRILFQWKATQINKLREKEMIDKVAAINAFDDFKRMFRTGVNNDLYKFPLDVHKKIDEIIADTRCK